MTKKRVSPSSSPRRGASRVAKGVLGKGGELHQQALRGAPSLTTNQGVPISDNQNSLKGNPSGAVLLEGVVCAIAAVASATATSPRKTL